mmetsp:Transcript_27728/g.43041  ORF Transcript_27728/g.43041 Transcript_27728/m.43041 type:complete len:87 (+) Transcript_27728:226-486(+)
MSEFEATKVALSDEVRDGERERRGKDMVVRGWREREQKKVRDESERAATGGEEEGRREEREGVERERIGGEKERERRGWSRCCRAA